MCSLGNQIIEILETLPVPMLFEIEPREIELAKSQNFIYWDLFYIL